MTSIRHFPATHPLPDWRNFGVMLRVLLGVNGLALLAALVQAGDIGKWLGGYLQMAAIVEPLLLAELGLLSLARNTPTARAYRASRRPKSRPRMTSVMAASKED